MKAKYWALVFSGLLHASQEAQIQSYEKLMQQGEYNLAAAFLDFVTLVDPVANSSGDSSVDSSWKIRSLLMMALAEAKSGNSERALSRLQEAKDYYAWLTPESQWKRNPRLSAALKERMDMVEFDVLKSLGRRP